MLETTIYFCFYEKITIYFHNHLLFFSSYHLFRKSTTYFVKKISLATKDNYFLKMMIFFRFSRIFFWLLAVESTFYFSKEPKWWFICKNFLKKLEKCGKMKRNGVSFFNFCTCCAYCTKNLAQFLKLPFIPDLPYFSKSSKFLEITIYFLDHLF